MILTVYATLAIIRSTCRIGTAGRSVCTVVVALSWIGKSLIGHNTIVRISPLLLVVLVRVPFIKQASTPLYPGKVNGLSPYRHPRLAPCGPRSKALTTGFRTSPHKKSLARPHLLKPVELFFHSRTDSRRCWYDISIGCEALNRPSSRIPLDRPRSSSSLLSPRLVFVPLHVEKRV